jgi:hypothetical protein
MKNSHFPTIEKGEFRELSVGLLWVFKVFSSRKTAEIGPNYSEFGPYF